MLRNPWELDIHARYQQDQVASSFHRLHATAAHGGDRPGSVARARRATGLRLIAVGEWLAGREAARPTFAGVPAPRA
jgi:hypothetical protein